MGTFSLSSLWKHLISLLVKEQTDLSAILDYSRCGSDCVDSLLLSWAVKAKKSVTAHEGRCCALIHDQRRDVVFGG